MFLQPSTLRSRQRARLVVPIEDLTPYDSPATHQPRLVTQARSSMGRRLAPDFQTHPAAGDAPSSAAGQDTQARLGMLFQLEMPRLSQSLTALGTGQQVPAGVCSQAHPGDPRLRPPGSIAPSGCVPGTRTPGANTSSRQHGKSVE